LARVLSRTMGVSGAEALSAVADIFVGMTEAALVVKPYLERMTRSELFAVVCGGEGARAGLVIAALRRLARPGLRRPPRAREPALGAGGPLAREGDRARDGRTGDVGRPAGGGGGARGQLDRRRRAGRHRGPAARRLRRGAARRLRRDGRDAERRP